MPRLLAIVLLLAFAAAGCGGDDPARPRTATRSYRMGFSGVPPRPDFDQAIAAIQMWVPRADAALILNEPPWDSLLAGVPPDTLVRRDPLPIARYYRQNGLMLVASIDPTNGLNRAEDAAALVAAGRSLAEPEIRELYRRYVVALDTLVRPEHLSVASETNLIRAAAPPALYAALVQNAAEAAAAVRAVDANVRLFTTVQVETAWGRLGGNGTYQGILQDRADFPFIQSLGLSSYPYLGGFAEPEQIPIDYYLRLTQGFPLQPAMVIEGGWHSETVDTLASSAAEQRRYLVRHAALLDAASAAAWFQITFTDLDPAFFPPGTILPLFATLGLVTADLAPKPALSAWDSVFAFRRR